MESRVRHFQLAVLMACGIAATGCAVTSGLQTYDLPTQGAYQTDQGAQLTVVQLTQDNLPSHLLNNIQSANSTYHLFNNKQHIYRLTAGDVLSIQLWAYPEITPPIQDISNIKAAGYPIDPNGNVYLPLLGQVKVAGKTLAETNQYLRSQFSRYLKHPDVVVRVLSYEGRRYFVNGQVMRSGK